MGLAALSQGIIRRNLYILLLPSVVVYLSRGPGSCTWMANVCSTLTLWNV